MIIQTKKGPRRQRSKEEWQALIVKQKSSGVCINDFCLQEGISDGSFYVWRKRFSEVETVCESSFSRIEIKSMEAVAASEGLMVILPGGLNLHFKALPPIEWIIGLSKGLNK